MIVIILLSLLNRYPWCPACFGNFEVFYFGCICWIINILFDLERQGIRLIVNLGRFTFLEKGLLSSGMSQSWNARMSSSFWDLMKPASMTRRLSWKKMKRWSTHILKYCKFFFQFNFSCFSHNVILHTNMHVYSLFLWSLATKPDWWMGGYYSMMRVPQI